MFRAAKLSLSFCTCFFVYITFFAAPTSAQTADDARARAQTLNRQAIQLIAEKKFEPAIKLLSEAIETDPLFPDVRVNLGTAYVLSGRPEMGLPHIKKCLELEPNSHVAYNQLGVAYDGLNENKLATEALEKAVALKPDYALAHVNLGKVYLFANDLKKGEREFEIGLKLDPRLEGEKVYLAAAYARRSKFSEAVNIARSVAEKQPQNEYANLMLCKLYLLANDRDSALRMYQSYKSTNVSLADAMFRSIFDGQVINAAAMSKP